MDPNSYQSGLLDSSSAGGLWQGAPLPVSQHPPQMQHGPGHMLHAPPPPQPPNIPPHSHPHPYHHHPLGVNIPRMMMPPRDLHFPPPHLRQYRSAMPPGPISSEYRIHDINKRLSMRTEECDSHWWDSFVNDFFEDDATLSLSICLDDRQKRFNIGRVLIPRFFRTLFDGGVTDVYFVLKQTKEAFHNPLLSLDCENASMVTSFGKPPYVKACTEGHLVIEFTFDDFMRIKSWNFSIKQFRELIPRSVVVIPTDNPNYLDHLSKNLTRCGLTSPMLNFLRLCEILEPMQELMSRHKTTSFSPRDCLKTILHQRWSKTCSDTRQPAKPRRKRKSNTGNSTPTNNNPNNLSMGKDSALHNSPIPPQTKKRSPGTAAAYSQPNQPPLNPTIANMPGDVMIVGEPSLMGGEMDDEDERYISRIENAQYDPNVAASSHLPPPPPPYLSPGNPIPPNFQTPQQPQNPNLQSLLHNKQQFIPNSPLIHPNQMKREQISFPGSPQPQQQALPSMFSNSGPGTPNSNSNMTTLPLVSSTLNGDSQAMSKRMSTTPTSMILNNPSTTSMNTSNSPSTPINHNQNPPTPISSAANPPSTPTNSSWNGTTNNNNSSSSNTNTVIGEKKQESQTPPATPQQQQQQQQTIATVS